MSRSSSTNCSKTSPSRRRRCARLIGRVIDQQHAEREAFLSALRVYKEETARLSKEVVVARSELTGQIEAARREREHLVAEFLDRVDELSAKVSTTASRYAAELADTNALLEAEGRKVEAYAGKAAIAQSVIDDMRQSTSWRITAPVRLVSRLLARPRPGPGSGRELAGRRVAQRVRSLLRQRLGHRPQLQPGGDHGRMPHALAEARSELIREIIVVDNGSDPEELSVLRRRHARGDFVLVEVGDEPVLRRGKQHRRRQRRRRLRRLPQQRRLRAARLDRGAQLDHADRPRTSPRSGRCSSTPTDGSRRWGASRWRPATWSRSARAPSGARTTTTRRCAVDFCSAACLMMRKADFLRVGGFGFEWEPAYYEDADLCLKL